MRVGLISDTHGLLRPEAIDALRGVDHILHAGDIGGTWIYVVHDLGDLDIDPVAAGVGVVMSGHSHKPLVFEEEGVTYVNPGSAGPRRFTLPVSIGYLTLAAQAPRASLRTLEIRG